MPKPNPNSVPNLNPNPKQVGRFVPASTLARMGRFGCAYGVGGVMNTTLTTRGREWARERYCPPALAGVSAGQSH